MNITWWMWFQRGLFISVKDLPPVTGLRGDKKWNDTRVEKTGKGKYETKDNGWNDEDTIYD